MRRSLTLAAATAVFLVVGLGSLVAEAAVVRYMSQHPIPRKMGGGFCYIDVPHVHDFGPSDPRMYRQVDGQFYFVGDPTPFDYDGPRHPFYGPHPVVEANVQFGHPEYCYLRGPHYHWYEPPAQAPFENRGGAYWYVGAYEPAYYEQRPRYVVVNDAYAPIVYTRPVVDITVAPPGFHGEIVAAGPGWRGAAVVAAPPPPVVQVGVGINLGGPPPPGVVVVDRHDHGRHHGWYKEERGGWRGPPPARGGGWRGNPQPVARGGGWRGTPPAQQGGGWRGTPPAQHGGGWRGAPAPQAHGGGGGRGNHGGWKR
ncbi:MAG TPA: hypothetical protein VHK47_22525 [Polyangia bacterium]|jgi:hypothetical protein|nr:hypothetical protein [Polyangia bacterium]